MRVRLAVAFAVVAVLVTFASRPARASGFLLYEQSAEAVGKGGAVAAGTREPAAVWFNPAALAFAPSRGASVMGALITARASFVPDGSGATVSTRRGVHPVPSVFAHAAVADRVQVGVGLFAPFGLALRWPDDWAGAQKALATRLRFIELAACAAYRVHDKLAIAAGLAAVRGDVKLSAELPREVGGRADLTGGGWGVGLGTGASPPPFNLAVLYRPWPETLHLAASYRSRVHVGLDGDADFSPQASGLDIVYPDQGVHSSITLPDLITFATMYRPRPRLELSAEVNLALWQTFDRLFIDFTGSTPGDQIIERRSRNAATFRVGGAWALARTPLVLRTGLAYVQNTTPGDTQHPIAPDGNRIGASAGLGYAIGRVAIDAGYMHVRFLDAKANPAGPMPLPGTYRAAVNAIALTVTVR